VRGSERGRGRKRARTSTAPLSEEEKRAVEEERKKKEAEKEQRRMEEEVRLWGDQEHVDENTPYSPPPLPEFTGVDKEGRPSDTILGSFTAESPPIDIFKFFFHDTLIDLIAFNSRQYAIMCGAGGLVDGFHPHYEPITPVDVHNYMGLWIRNGLSPAPDIRLHFSNPQHSTSFGDERVRRMWGGPTRGLRKLRYIRRFLHVSSNDAYPDLTDPLYKIRPLLAELFKKCLEAWCPGRNISLDEITIGFQGSGPGVLRIKYKDEGDGFQADALATSGKWGGFVLAFIFRHEDLPAVPEGEDYDMERKLAPTHRRSCWLMGHLKEKNPNFFYLVID
jgi:hypothetical protein